MLTKEQRVKLDTMVRNYEIGMLATHKVTREQIKFWVARYKMIMGYRLQK